MTDGVSAGEAMMLANGGMGGNWAWIIILLLAFGGNGFGRNGDNARIQDVYASNDQQTLMDQIRGITYGQSDSTFALNNSILTQSNMLQRDMLGGFYNLNNTMQNCCCETNRNIDAVKYENAQNSSLTRYENAQNTCAITNAIRTDGEETRKLLIQNKIDELRAKVAEKDQQLQSANFALSQQSQNATIINALRPNPIPAYTVQNPYVSTYNGCGCLY